MKCWIACWVLLQNKYMYTATLLYVCSFPFFTFSRTFLHGRVCMCSCAYVYSTPVFYLNLLVVEVFIFLSWGFILVRERICNHLLPPPMRFVLSYFHNLFFKFSLLCFLVYSFIHSLHSVYHLLLRFLLNFKSVKKLLRGWLPRHIL